MATSEAGAIKSFSASYTNFTNETEFRKRKDFVLDSIKQISPGADVDIALYNQSEIGKKDSHKFLVQANIGGDINEEQKKAIANIVEKEFKFDENARLLSVDTDEGLKNTKAYIASAPNIKALVALMLEREKDGLTREQLRDNMDKILTSAQNDREREALQAFGDELFSQYDAITAYRKQQAQDIEGSAQKPSEASQQEKNSADNFFDMISERGAREALNSVFDSEIFKFIAKLAGIEADKLREFFANIIGGENSFNNLGSFAKDIFNDNFGNDTDKKALLARDMSFGSRVTSLDASQYVNFANGNDAQNALFNSCLNRYMKYSQNPSVRNDCSSLTGQGVFAWASATKGVSSGMINKLKGLASSYSENQLLRYSEIAGHLKHFQVGSSKQEVLEYLKSLPDGSIIATDKGATNMGFDKGRPTGIDHILTLKREGDNVYIIENTLNGGGNATRKMSVDDYMKHGSGKSAIQFYCVDGDRLKEGIMTDRGLGPQNKLAQNETASDKIKI